VEQERHHVGLGEELGDGREFVGADFHIGGVHLVFALGLPELVDPTQAIGGAEGVRIQAGDELGQFALVLGGEAQVQGRGVVAENLGQHAGGIAAGEFPAIGGAFVLGEFVAVGQGDGHAVRVHEEVVLRQEAGEEHAVPVLVGDFPDQVADILDARSALTPGPSPACGRGEKSVTQLAAVQAQAATQFGLVRGEVYGCLRLTHAQVLQGRTCCGFGDVAGRLDGGFQAATQGLAERMHGHSFTETPGLGRDAP